MSCVDRADALSWDMSPRSQRLRDMWGRSDWGERVYAEGENDEGKYWGNAEEAMGNKNPAKLWGLRDENSLLLNKDYQNMTLEYSLPMECI